MSILVTGNTYTANDQVTSTNLNESVNNATFASGAVDNISTQISSGSIIVKDGGVSPAKISAGGPSWNSGGTVTATAFSGPLTGDVTGNVNGTSTNVTGTVAIANGGTAATTASAARTSLGILGSNLNSNLSASAGVTQAGSSGSDLVFNTSNAPTVTLTAGTWLLIGSVAARTSDVADAISAQFWNNTDSVAFGGGAAQFVETDLPRTDLGCVGVTTVTASKVIYFKVFRTSASTLDVGSSTPSGPSGFIQAIRLTN
jgi:hypothetical protein